MNRLVVGPPVSALCLAVLTGCGGSPRSPASQPAPAAPVVASGALRLPAIWVFTGTDVPAFCLVLSAGGQAEFQGGFRYLNPMRWTYAADHRFTLSAPSLRTADSVAMAEYISRGSLLSYDPATRTMAWALHPDAAGLPLLGYVLVPAARLLAAERTAVRSSCPALG